MLVFFNILQRAALLLGAMLFFIACVDNSEIDRTNTTLEANLEELKRLNQGFNNMSATITRDLKPIEAISQQFAELTKLIAEAGSGVPEALKKTTQASEGLLRLLEVIPPEKIGEFSEEIEEAVGGIADLSKNISEFVPTLDRLESRFLPTLEQLGLSGMILVKQGLKLGTVTPEEWEPMRAAFITMVESNQELAPDAKEQIKKQLLESAELAADQNFMTTVENAVEKLGELDRRLESLDGEVAKFEELIGAFDVAVLTDTATDFKTFMDMVLPLLPTLEQVAANVRNMTKEMKDFRDGPGGLLYK